MKQNITLRLDKSLIAKAKVIAAQRQTSVSRMLSKELKRMVEDAERYEQAKIQALANLKKGYHLGGEMTTSRDELHER
jgi:predicted transcriptional regulator